MEKITALPIIISILFLIISFFLVSIKINNLVKLLSIISLNLLGFFVWFIIPFYLGYATVDRLPDKWVLIWANVNKPYYIEVLVEPYNPFDNKNNLFSYKTDYLEKRFYRCKYDEQFAKDLEDNMEKAQNGVKVVFSRKEKGDKGSGGITGSGGTHGEFIPHPELPLGMPPKE